MLTSTNRSNQPTNMADKKEQTSVKSPTNATDGLVKNAGGMPPKMTFEQIQAENTPPSTPAKDSTTGIGHISGN